MVSLCSTTQHAIQICDTAVDWGATGSILSAIATVIATVVALWLPGRAAKKEWARQDRLRIADAKRDDDLRAAAHQRDDDLRAAQVAQAKLDRKYVIHQGCSTVDQIVAYLHAARAMNESAPVYLEGFNGIDRIHENTLTLKEILAVMRTKPEVSDGLLFTMVNAGRLADVILGVTLPAEGGFDPNWIARVHQIDEFKPLAELTHKRNRDVREAFELQPSQSAVAIQSKYDALAAAIVHARESQLLVDMTAVPQNHY